MINIDSNSDTTNPPIGYLSTISYLATQIQRLTGGTDWYTAPAFSLSQLSNNWSVISANSILTPNSNILLAANNLELTFPQGLNEGNSFTLVPPAGQVLQCTLNFNGYNFNSYGVSGLLGYLTISEPYTFVYAGESLGITPLLTQPQVAFNGVSMAPPTSTAATQLTGTVFSSTPLTNTTAESAFDGDLTTSFASSVIPAYIGIDLVPHAAQLQFLRFFPSIVGQFGGYYEGALWDSEIQGWNGSSWDTLYTIESSDYPTYGAMGQVNINTTNSYSKYQLSNNDLLSIAELEFWGNYTS